MPAEIPDADPDEPVETKPFKFVTGMLILLPCSSFTVVAVLDWH